MLMLEIHREHLFYIPYLENNFLLNRNIMSIACTTALDVTMYSECGYTKETSDTERTLETEILRIIKNLQPQPHIRRSYRTRNVI